MERINELEACVKEYWEEHLEIKKSILPQNSTKMEDTFRLKLGCLIDEQVKCQKAGQDKIKYIFMYNLISSDYTGSYEVMLGMSNSMLYLDEMESRVYWRPAPIYEDFDDDMREVEKRLQKQFVHLSSHELFCLRQKLLYSKWLLVNECF